MAERLAVIEDHRQGISQDSNHGEDDQRLAAALMDRGLLEMAVGGDGLKRFRVDGPAAPA